jgi:hypothetical protein
MIWQNYQLDNTILTTNEDLTLWQVDKGVIEINKNALAIPIKLDNQQKGYIFHGNGKLLLDTIVETDEGAIGEPVEKEITEPFLMLGDTEETQQHLSTANKENLTEMGYKSEQEFIAKAEDLFSQFLGRERIHSHQCCRGSVHGFIFAFPNKAEKLDILVANGSRLVYKAMSKVFVSNENKVVLKTPKEVIVSGGRRSIVIKK